MDLGRTGFGSHTHTEQGNHGSDDDMIPVTDKMNSNYITSSDQTGETDSKAQRGDHRIQLEGTPKPKTISAAQDEPTSSTSSLGGRAGSQELGRSTRSQTEPFTALDTQIRAAGEGQHDNNGTDDSNEETIEEVWRRLSALPPVQPIQLSFFKKVSIASGHILNDLCASLWFSYLLLYFQKVVKFDYSSSSYDSQYAASLMFLGQVVDGVATPLVGYEADREVNCWLCRAKYGRCKSWHLVGSICVALSFPFIFSPCIGCTEDTTDWAKLIYYSPFIAIFQIGWASSQISHLALIPKMHPDELVRTEMLAIRYAFTVLANVTVFLMTWFTLGNNDKCQITPDDATSFMTIAFAAVGTGAFFTLLFHANVQEDDDTKIKQNVAILNSRTQLMRRLSVLSRTSDNLENSFMHNSTSSRHSEPGGDIRTGANRRLKPRSRTRSGGSTGSGSGRRTKSLSEVICGTGRSEEGDNLLSAHADRDPESTLPLLPEEESDTAAAEPELRSRRFQRSMSIDNDLRVEILSVHSRGDPDEDTNDTLRRSRLSTKNLNIGKEKMTMKDWLTLPQFYIVALVYMATRQSVNLAQVYMPLYLQDSLLLPCRTVATIPLTMYISGFFVSTGLKKLNKHLGRQLAYIAGATLCVAGSLIVLLLDWDGAAGEFDREYIIYAVAVLLGGGASAILVTSLSITADMIGNNVENGAFVYGAMSFCDKVSCGLTILLVSTLVPCGDDDSRNNLTDDNPCKQLKNKNVEFYRNVLGYSAGGCALVGVLGIILLTLQIHFQSHAQKLRVLQAERARKRQK